VFTDVVDGEAASDLEFGEDAVAGFDGEAVDEGLGYGFADGSGSVEGYFSELVS
jgi:hypothetical protein